MLHPEGRILNFNAKMTVEFAKFLRSSEGIIKVKMAVIRISILFYMAAWKKCLNLKQIFL